MSPHRKYGHPDSVPQECFNNQIKQGVSQTNGLSYSGIIRRVHFNLSNGCLLQCAVDSHHVNSATSKIIFFHQLSSDNNAIAVCIMKDLNFILTNLSNRKKHTLPIFITQAGTITHDFNFLSRFELQTSFILHFNIIRQFSNLCSASNSVRLRRWSRGVASTPRNSLRVGDAPTEPLLMPNFATLVTRDCLSSWSVTASPFWLNTTVNRPMTNAIT